MSVVKDPEIGDVGLVKVRGVVGKLIGFGEFLNGTKWRNRRYQHSLLYLGSGLALEAQPGGALIFKIEQRWKPEDITWVRVADLPVEQQDNLISAAHRMIGTPYSFLDYVALLVRRTHLPIPGLKNYVNSTKHMICSQIIAEVYRRIGTELFDGRWPGYVTPADYFERYGS